MAQSSSVSSVQPSSSPIARIVVLPLSHSADPVPFLPKGVGVTSETLFILSPVEDAKSQKIGVDQLKEVLQRLSATHSHNTIRYLCVFPADALTIPAQHAFLKFLEEPPPNTQSLLYTAKPHSLLATIRSRCMMDTETHMATSINTLINRSLHPVPGTPAELLSLTSSLASREDSIRWCEESMTQLHLTLYDHPTEQLYAVLSALREALHLLNHNVPHRTAIESPFLRHVFHLPDTSIDLFGQSQPPIYDTIEELRAHLFSIEDATEVVH